jgi:hypothetical protein
MLKLKKKSRNNDVFVYSMLYTKNSDIPLFLGRFYNLHSILTRTVSQFKFSIQNQNQATATRSASFSKYETKISSCSINFCQISMICDSKQPKLVSALSETKRMFRLFCFYTRTESFDVLIEPKQTEDHLKQFDREHILLFFTENLGFFR